ncbi:MAG: Coenzyme F420 hydrogenase/dehydrogenase, beta subunit C-terminal domain [Oscillospiraceae bacterium]|nr:Coenzyme F420 hydrogenase/dehydrogenase, beta subunit C-terminal domain [Oscillospiraceae bacterium]
METYFSTNYKPSCYGCKACEQICLKDCIDMQFDEEGFEYPEIKQEKCVKCSMCENVCPINSTYIKEDFLEEADIYATTNKDEETRSKSSSGGMFTIYSDYILEQGGVVFGAVFDDAFKIIHKEAKTKEAAEEFRGSKYAQSDSREIYKDIKKYLSIGKKVLFSGTPCQVAGLYSYLGKDHENLFTIDLICHGVMSPGVFKDYLSYVNKKNDNYDIKEIKFRSKVYGWGNCFMHIEYKNGQKYIRRELEDLCFRAFSKNIAQRPACYDCRFSKSKREADITIGDYWGVEKHKPHLYDLRGVSLLFNNSRKAQEIFEKVKDKMEDEKCKLEEVLQPNLIGPTKKNALREEFFEVYGNDGFEKAIEVLNKC